MAEIDRDYCAALDAADPLAPMRARFTLPDGLIYLDGNSLGALPAAVPGRIAAVLRDEWGTGLIGSWTEAGWIDKPLALGDAIAPLIGAAPGEVAVTDSTSVNLFKLLAAALQARPGRHSIVTELGNFPTDLYIAEGLSGLVEGCRVRRVARDRIAGALDSDSAVLTLTHIDFRTGFMHDMAVLTAAAHDAGALVLWDLSHSVGAVPLDVGGAGVDLAVGCTYKYLNGGPGAPAFAFVSKALQSGFRPGLSGWMGHRAPFDFAADYAPAAGIAPVLSGTPAVLGLAALETALKIWHDVDIAQLRAKSVALCDLFIALVESRCAGFDLASPRDAVRRGSQVSFRHRDAAALVAALADRRVIGDFRPPDVMRFGLAPLYLRYADIWDTVERLAEVAAAG
jgi:kynureninase